MQQATPQNQGVFFFYDWLEVLDQLPPRISMTIIHNLMLFDRDGIEPPPLRGQANFVQSVFASQLERRKRAARYGRMGAEARYARSAEGTDDQKEED